jgi:hypothetical protein
MQKTFLATAVACGLLVGLPFDLAAQTAPAPQDEAQVQTLLAQLQALKASYAQQVRQLRELDMQVQALQARLEGKAAPGSLPAPAGTPPAQQAQVAQATPHPDEGGRAGSAAEAEAARQEAPTRSLKDALQQEHALFDRRFTLENSVSYSRYDRSQITLNGFLALDAIFLGNIAIEDVKSDSLTYNLAARYGVSPRLTLNLDVPYLGRKTVYQKGGAGGSAAAIAEEQTTGSVKLGKTYYFGAGVAFAFNERTSLSLSFSDKLTAKAALRYRGSPWTKVIGSDANAATFNMGVTHALSPHTTLVSMLGIGLTQDAPDYTLSFKGPYMF